MVEFNYADLLNSKRGSTISSIRDEMPVLIPHEGDWLVTYTLISTSKLADEKGECKQKPVPLDRFSRHTLICSSCHRAYQVTNKLEQGAVGVAIAMAALGIVADGFSSKIAAVSAFLGAVALAAVAKKIKTKFERNYTRH